MLSRLVDIQYQRNDIAFERSKFRVRGDCVEIWPSYEEFAYRIEFWGDEIEQLSIINPIIRRNHLDPGPAVHLSGQTLCDFGRTDREAVEVIQQELKNDWNYFARRANCWRPNG